MSRATRKHTPAQFTAESMGHLLLLTGICRDRRLALSFDSFLNRGKMNWTCYVWGVGDDPVAKGRGENCGEAALAAYKELFEKQK